MTVLLLLLWLAVVASVLSTPWGRDTVGRWLFTRTVRAVRAALAVRSPSTNRAVPGGTLTGPPEHIDAAVDAWLAASPTLHPLTDDCAPHAEPVEVTDLMGEHVRWLCSRCGMPTGAPKPAPPKPPTITVGTRLVPITYDAVCAEPNPHVLRAMADRLRTHLAGLKEAADDLTATWDTRLVPGAFTLTTADHATYEQIVAAARETCHLIDLCVQLADVSLVAEPETHEIRAYDAEHPVKTIQTWTTTRPDPTLPDPGRRKEHLA